ncbi:MAG: hypothetical protein JWN56_2856 [Sphingobacteriales bacterium]|nr:hypothetical protein [Sphingobacteriales bacterium]
MINYEVDHEILTPYLPKGTELDLYDDKCLVSLVGFMFLDTRILSMKFPFHINFEEFNLRFYVRYLENGEWKRGTVFISEIVPKFMIPVVANTLYREHYKRYPMKHSISANDDLLKVEYSFKIKNNWNSVSASAHLKPIAFDVNSLEEFITEHYWGYNRWDKNTTFEYGVEHPQWLTYPLKSVEIDCHFEDIYPAEFLTFLYKKYHSALLAEGSSILVRKGRILQ